MDFSSAFNTVNNKILSLFLSSPGFKIDLNGVKTVLRFLNQVF